MNQYFNDTVSGNISLFCELILNYLDIQRQITKK